MGAKASGLGGLFRRIALSMGWGKRPEDPDAAIAARDQARWRELRFWPEDKPMPETYDRRRPPPCPACRRVRLDDLGQAVARRAEERGTAYLHCKACGAEFHRRCQATPGGSALAPRDPRC